MAKLIPATHRGGYVEPSLVKLKAFLWMGAFMVLVPVEAMGDWKSST